MGFRMLSGQLRTSTYGPTRLSCTAYVVLEGMRRLELELSASFDSVAALATSRRHIVHSDPWLGHPVELEREQQRPMAVGGLIAPCRKQSIYGLKKRFCVVSGECCYPVVRVCGRGPPHPFLARLPLFPAFPQRSCQTTFILRSHASPSLKACNGLRFLNFSRFFCF